MAFVDVSFEETPGVTPGEIVGDGGKASRAKQNLLKMARRRTGELSPEAIAIKERRERRAALLIGSGSGAFDIMTDEEAARARARAATSQAKLGQTAARPSGGGGSTSDFGFSGGGGGGGSGSLRPYTRIVQSTAATGGTAGDTAGLSVSKEALASLAEAKKQYQPGGGYGAGLEATLERGAKKSIAAGTQSLVSAGLASTSMGASLGKQYEEEVATPARADLESRRAVALSGLETLEAQMQQGGYQAEIGRTFQSSEAVAGREFTGIQASLDRQFQARQTEANRFTQINQAALDRQFQARQTEAGRDFQMEQMQYASPQAPTAGQHITSSTGVSSFLANLRSQDIMTAPDWNFGK